MDSCQVAMRIRYELVRSHRQSIVALCSMSVSIGHTYVVLTLSYSGSEAYNDP